MIVLMSEQIDSQTYVEVAIIGAGPAGAAAAIHAARTGYDTLLIAVSYTHLTLPTIYSV